MGRVKDLLMDIEDKTWFLLSKNPKATVEELTSMIQETFKMDASWIVQHVWDQHKERGNTYYDG
jgi:hypothetical protein